MMRSILKPILLLLISFAVSFAGSGCRSEAEATGDQPAPQADSIILQDKLIRFQDHLSLLPYIQVLPDADETLAITDVMRMDAGTDFSIFEQNTTPISRKAVYWFTLEVANPDTFARQWVLYLGYEQEVAIFGPDEEKRVGTMVPAREKTGAFEPGLFLRDQGYSGQVLLELQGGESRRLYLRVKRILNAPMYFDFQLFDLRAWQSAESPRFRHFGQGFFQGIIWALILYHLIFFLMVRDVTYIHYSVYMICISLLTLGDFGYWQGVLFNNQPYLGWGLFLFLQYFTGIMTFVFMQRFVQLERLLPKWNVRVTRFIRGNIALLSVMAVAYLVTQHFLIVQLGKLLIVPFALAGILFCYLLIRSRDTVALYFAAAGGVFALAILMNGISQVLSQQGVLLQTPYHRYYILQIAAVAHLMTFAVGMGFRRRQIDLEKQRVVELDKMKTRLYTNITHEFRTPLTVIMGMNEHISGHEQEKSMIRRNSQNLLRLINQLLDLSKLDSGKLQLNVVNGEIIVYLQYLTESFHSMAEERDIRLTFYAEEAEIRMDYDEVKIQHIVYNLLSNAIKFTGERGKVVFHVRREAPYLQMIIQDSGVGISAGQLPHIFDRFYQADDSHTRKGEGTGIGLALTKELIDLMGGEISVSSAPGKGTAFRISLPITNNAPEQDANRVEEIKAGPLREETEGEIAIHEIDATDADLPILLLIEDNPDVVVYIQTLLQADYRIYLAANGQIGIDKAYDLIPDIIISDVMMPQKDGYEVCQTLKSDVRTSHIPIVLLTAKARQEDRIEGLKYGADAYLTKPFNKEELMVRLEKLVTLRRQLQQRYANYTPTMGDEAAPESMPAHPLEDEFLAKLRMAVQKHLDEADFSVPQLAAAVNMSQMQLYRKLKALADRTPSQWIRSIRLQKAVELLRHSDLTISEIAYDVGFTDPNYFARAFHQEFGKPPSLFRN